MKLALCQINPTVADLAGNAAKILDFARRAADRGAELAVFPEMCLTGYPPQDLLEKRHFIDDVNHALAVIIEHIPRELGVVLGVPLRNEYPTGKPLLNAAVLLEDGRIIASAHKVLLPTYDVFDEVRHFEPGQSVKPVEFRGLRLGLHVCEDMWGEDRRSRPRLYARDPITELAEQGVDLFVNISASPFAVGKHQVRNDVVARISERYRKPFVLVNQVGANTELLFDGDSRGHRSDGRLGVVASSFTEDLVFWDPWGSEVASVQRDAIADLHDALVMGIRDYFQKTSAFEKALVGLSGGIDSAVTCALAVEALGRDRVVGVTMPGPYSSSGSVEDSRDLAESLGIEFHEVSILPAVEAFSGMLSDVFDRLPSDSTEENIQARARGVTLMAMSNKFGYLLLSTGNKSEMAVGYATLYGDMSGGLSVLSDVFKQEVYALARHINESANEDVIPQHSITKPPSAELRPGQLDQDTLPPYEALDAILRLYVEELRDRDEIVELTRLDQSLVTEVLRMVDRNEYKRRQAAPGLRVSNRAFGVGRRMPVVMHRTRVGEESAIVEASSP